jgi:triacylglycerol lipase
MRFVPQTLVTEAIATLRTALFPLARLDLLPAPGEPDARPPVLLVHGFLGHPDMLRPLARRLLTEGWTQVVRVGYPSVTGSVDDAAHAIARAIERLPDDRPVDLVGHSLGAVACRAYLKVFAGPVRVRRFVSLGGPHAGTSLYRVVPPQLRTCMDPRGPWVARLAQGPEPVPTTVIRARYDQQVLPPIRAALPGAHEILLDGLGHNALLWSPRAHDAVVAALTAPDAHPHA